MDDETRYWIAQEVADTKYVHDARALFQKAKEVTGKRPLTLITDGAHNYEKAFTKEFYSKRTLSQSTSETSGSAAKSITTRWRG